MKSTMSSRIVVLLVHRMVVGRHVPVCHRPSLVGWRPPGPPTVDHTVERDEQGCADLSHASPPEMLPVCTGLRVFRRPTGEELIATGAWPSTNVRACGGRRVIPP